jgi:hypothetical protein
VNFSPRKSAPRRLAPQGGSINKLIAPFAVFALCVGATRLSAQTGSVGYPPTQSPYVDLEHHQEFSFVVGDFHAHRDPANVGPQSGLLYGGRYEWRPSGPIHLIAEFDRINSDRRLINPAKPASTRELGTVSRPLYSADFGLGLGLTGGKSWHHIIPEVAAGGGAVSDFRSKPDSGGLRFGTRFAFTWGAGLKIVPGGRWQIRADMKNRSYTFAYPDSYYLTPAGGQPVVSATQAKSFWMNNPAYTLGLSYLF